MRTICPICRQRVKTKLKEVKRIMIYECEKCLLSIISKNLVQPVNNFYSLIDYQKEAYRFKKRFIRLVSIITQFRPTGKVLDIGSGFGLFSSVLNQKGDYYFYLIDKEVEPYYFKNIANSQFQKIDFFDFINKKNIKNFDLILMFDVLEHFKNPLFALKKLKKILNDNGYLVIQTPNYQSLMAAICQNWSWWMVEDHKVVFSPKSIRKLLTLSGFEIEYFKTYEEGYDFKKNFDGNFEKIKIHFIRRLLKLFFYGPFFLLYFFLRKIFWFFNWGGLIFLIAKKRL